MWKILGMRTIYIDIPNTVKERLAELSADKEKGEKFRELMDRSEIMFLLNGETEENSFYIKVPDELTPEEIQLMADVVLDIAKTVEFPFVSVGDIEQRYRIIISNNKEPELIGMNKTPGMSSVEVFKPIIKSWDGRGRSNAEGRGRYQ
ncbi:MAG: hypothetical protein FWC44_02215 [Methanomassiliicoccaceae archaeon]|nr:hypothetical protein [Methanomassiliicoccaceae archaeon]